MGWMVMPYTHPQEAISIKKECGSSRVALTPQKVLSTSGQLEGLELHDVLRRPMTAITHALGSRSVQVKAG